MPKAAGSVEQERRGASVRDDWQGCGLREWDKDDCKESLTLSAYVCIY